MGQFLSLETAFARHIRSGGSMRLFSAIIGHKKTITKTV